MSNKKDLMSLGQAYGDVLNRVVVREDKLPVPAGEVGDAPLESGGPEEKAGFRPSKIDITRMSKKDKEDNIYNIKGYTYGDGNNPGNTNQPDPTGPEFDQVPYSGIVGPEEDEEDISIYDGELFKAAQGYKSRAGLALLKRGQQELQSQGCFSTDTRLALANDFFEEDEEEAIIVWKLNEGRAETLRKTGGAVVDAYDKIKGPLGRLYRGIFPKKPNEHATRRAHQRVEDSIKAKHTGSVEDLEKKLAKNDKAWSKAKAKDAKWRHPLKRAIDPIIPIPGLKTISRPPVAGAIYGGYKSLAGDYETGYRKGEASTQRALGRDPEKEGSKLDKDKTETAPAKKATKKPKPESNKKPKGGPVVPTGGGLKNPITGKPLFGPKKKEEEEEFLAEHEKIARSSLNNFMSKSVFDKLYNKVMVNENFDEVEDVSELEALGIETDEVVDEVPEEITVSIPGELAQTLCDILQTALAQQEVEVDVDVDVEAVEDVDFEEDAESKRYGTGKHQYRRHKGPKGVEHRAGEGPKGHYKDYEEDEEAQMKDGGGYGIDAGSTYTKEVNYGKKNRVGRLRPATGLAQKDGGGYGVDAGSTYTKEIDYARKNNKVGNMKLGNIPGA